MSKIFLDSTIVRSPDQVSTDLGGEVVTLALNSGQYYGLEEVGARIWDLIEEPKAVKQILDLLLKEYEVESERCERDLLAVLQEMADEGLVEIKNEATR